MNRQHALCAARRLPAGRSACFLPFFFALLSGDDKDGAPKKGFTICSCNCAARYAIINNKENRAAIFPGRRRLLNRAPKEERRKSTGKGACACDNV